MGEVLAGADAGANDYAAVVSVAYAILPPAGKIPGLRFFDKPVDGDGAAWLDRELRTGLGPSDPAGQWRGFPRKVDSRDVNYGRGAVPASAVFRGSFDQLQSVLSSGSQWPVEGVILWGRMDLAAMMMGFLIGLGEFCKQIQMTSSGGGGY